MKTVSLITSSLAVFSITFMITSMNVALPFISEDFQADVILLGWVVTAYVLAVAVLSLPFGRISDIFGIKKLFLAGVVLYTLGLILAAVSNSTITLIIARAILGIGGALVVPNALAMIIAVYPANERGKALGLNTACVFMGSSLGPFLGGILTAHLGWRSIFLINIPIILIVIFLLAWKIPGEWCASRGEKFDYKGSLVFGFALVALMLGFSYLPEIRGIILVLTGLAGLGIFIKVENGIRSPLLNINAFKTNRTFIYSNLAALIIYSVVFALTFLLSLYLQYNKGFSPEQAGLILVVQPVVQAVLSPFIGRLSDKIEPRIITSAGMLLVSFGLLSFVFLANGTSLVQIILGLAILGTGFALFASPNINAIMSSVEPKSYGVASAMISTTRCVGQMLSMGITIMVMATVVGRVIITPEFYPAYLTGARISFAIFTVMCLAGVFASLARGKQK